MLGYAASDALGARLCHLGHTTLLAALLQGAGCWRSNSLITALALIWLADIGLDRLLGFGLKYNDHSAHTHLGNGSASIPSPSHEVRLSMA